MKQYIESNKDRFLDELFSLLRIPSISADPAYAEDVNRTAKEVANRLTEAGANNVEICPTEGYPIVYGDYFVAENLPTVLVYGHYDVQPADPLELWTSPPFEPVVKDGKIYARGASDDKGQMYMHVKALETLLKNGGVPVNLKFMIEGEEEVGSENLDRFVEANHDKLRADVVLISDTGIISNEQPSITTGLRGLAYLEVELTGPDKDLHSGMFGGAVANPINVLCDMVSSLHDDKRRITIPGFYDEVEEVSAEERAQMASAPVTEEGFMESLDVDGTMGEEGYSSIERIGMRPTLDVNGIWGGYIGEGAKTVIASKAYAKISMRLVPRQNSAKITQLFKSHFESIAPKGIKVKVTPHHGGEPAVTPTDSLAYKAAFNAVGTVWGVEPIPMREGGSIPIVALFEKELGINSMLMGFGLDEDAIHSPNESYGIENFLKGIESICEFHHEFAKLNQ